MSDIPVKIDGKDVKASGGMTILEAARSGGIEIPTLCHHEKLTPYGACRICTVEIETGGRTSLVAACLYPVEPNMIVRTRSDKVDKTRKMLLELMLSHGPDSPVLQELAREYGADPNRFEKRPEFCILCGLCVRYCAEVVKKNAVGFVDRGVKREIAFVPEIASKECWSCKGCFPLCPTEYLQASFMLTQALSPEPFTPAPPKQEPSQRIRPS